MPYAVFTCAQDARARPQRPQPTGPHPCAAPALRLHTPARLPHHHLHHAGGHQPGHAAQRRERWVPAWVGGCCAALLHAFKALSFCHEHPTFARLPLRSTLSTGPSLGPCLAMPSPDFPALTLPPSLPCSLSCLSTKRQPGPALPLTTGGTPLGSGAADDSDGATPHSAASGHEYSGGAAGSGGSRGVLRQVLRKSLRALAYMSPGGQVGDPFLRPTLCFPELSFAVGWVGRLPGRD